jgi:anti-sigma B factor antagonist
VIVVTDAVNGWHVAGELDAASSRELRAAVRQLPQAACGQAEIDLEGVTFIDSSGLGELIDLSNRLRSESRGLIVRNPSRPVRRLLDLTQLSGVFGLDGVKDSHASS